MEQEHTVCEAHLVNSSHLPHDFLQKGTISNVAQDISSVEGRIWAVALLFASVGLLVSGYTFQLYRPWLYSDTDEERRALDGSLPPRRCAAILLLPGEVGESELGRCALDAFAIFAAGKGCARNAAITRALRCAALADADAALLLKDIRAAPGHAEDATPDDGPKLAVRWLEHDAVRSEVYVLHAATVRSAATRASRVSYSGSVMVQMHACAVGSPTTQLKGEPLRCSPKSFTSMVSRPASSSRICSREEDMVCRG